ncbi:MAG: hypothetical protein ACOCP8_01015 [archaeon]
MDLNKTIQYLNLSFVEILYIILLLITIILTQIYAKITGNLLYAHIGVMLFILYFFILMYYLINKLFNDDEEYKRYY